MKYLLSILLLLLFLPLTLPAQSAGFRNEAAFRQVVAAMKATP